MDLNMILKEKSILEWEIYKHVSNWIQLRFPGIIYHFDYGSGLKMTKGQARKQKLINRKRGFPDLFIAEARGGYHGLFIEIKRSEKIYVNDHVREQRKVLKELEKRGYMAVMVGGLENVINTIQNYLNLK